MNTTLSPAGILGPHGRISQKLKQYEHRHEQLAMAEAVAQAIDRRTHLIAEAGTGTGKSFAYLVPAILAATARQRDESKEPGEKPDRTRVVISTHTISLQEQLIGKDIPFLNAVLPLEFSAVLVKGRGNYVSLRRLKGTADRAGSMFADPRQVDQVGELLKWAHSTSDGSLASLSFRPPSEVWDEVRSDHGNCLGKKCPTYEDCLYYKARRRIWNADVLVVNHALFFADLALRREGASVLPDYQVVIFDEAHTVEHVASEHLGIKVTSGQVDYLLNKLYNSRSQKGLLVHHQFTQGQKLVVDLGYIADDLFGELRHYRDQHCGKNGRVRRIPEVTTDLASPLRDLGRSIATFAESIQSEENRIELEAAAQRCLGLAVSLESWLGQTLAGGVYWIEVGGRSLERVELCCSPVEIASVLRDELFSKVPTVVLTSATLAVGGQSFDFIRRRLGVDHSAELKVDSPFNFQENAKLLLPAGMPDPTESPFEYENAVCDRIRKYVDQTQGRAFVLFTSFKMLDSCARKLTDWFRQHGYSLYSQGEGT
ncbi:MAG: helicase, partial [Planctomycetaceae bacterium]